MTENEVGFVSLSKGTGASDASWREIGVGMLGYGFMGKAHTNAYKKIPYIFWPPAAKARLVGICGVPQEAAEEAARRYEYGRATSDWRELIADPAIELLDNCGPNSLHAEPCIEAAKAGKHVLCEKPLARSAGEAKRMWNAVREAGVKHLCSFNYRFVPAVRLAKELIDAGEIGEIYHFRASYLQEWIMDPGFPWVWRLSRDVSGSGALGDLGAHIIDLSRFLVGEPASLSATTETFIKQRTKPGGGEVVPVDVDDAFEAIVRFENGAIGTYEATRFAGGHKNGLTFEINGAKRSLRFNLERLNELEICDVKRGQGQGFRTVSVTESNHPYMNAWWAHGHNLGWEHAHIHTLHHLLDSIANDTDVAPYGATFEDGYKCAVICDAILASSVGGERVSIQY